MINSSVYRKDGTIEWGGHEGEQLGAAGESSDQLSWLCSKVLDVF